MVLVALNMVFVWHGTDYSVKIGFLFESYCIFQWILIFVVFLYLIFYESTHSSHIKDSFNATGAHKRLNLNQRYD